jgi:hypothetical protein
MSHIFTLQVSGLDTATDYEDRLYEAGCSDALPAIVDGTLYLDFDRDAPSFDDAIKSARQDVESAGGKVVQVMQTPE